MTPCELRDTADVEIYFYGELDPRDRARVERHLRGCEPCRQRLEDLHAIRRALASRPAVESPPAGDWSGFMRRLDRSTEGLRPSDSPTRSLARRFPPSLLRATARQAAGALRSRGSLTAFARVAAMIAIVACGLYVGAKVRSTRFVGQPTSTVQNPADAPGTGSTPARHANTEASRVRALRENSAEHLERSKLVVLGLATRDPRARRQDWQYERALAGTLLSETRLYRQAAIQEGASDVARVMRDLETVLLQASMSDRKDRDALERVQRLIAKRDLVVNMQVMAAAGPAGN